MVTIGPNINQPSRTRGNVGIPGNAGSAATRIIADGIASSNPYAKNDGGTVFGRADNTTAQAPIETTTFGGVGEGS